MDETREALEFDVLFVGGGPANLVAMLANYNIWLVPPVAFFFACLNVGSIQLPMALALDSSLSGVIQGALVLATLGVHAWQKRRAEIGEREKNVGMQGLRD